MKPQLKLLLVARALRSTALGYMGVIAPIYLARLGYSAVRVGLVFTAGAFGSMALTLAVSMLADRWGRRRLLVALGLLTSLAGLGFTFGRSLYVLLAAAAAGSVGRGGGAGSGGAFGPYFPAEQALIAEHAGDRDRTRVFGVVALVGTLSGALGSLVAMTPALMRRGLGLALMSGDRLLFGLTALIGLALAAVVLPVTERPRAPRRPGLGLHPRTSHVLWRFVVTNATNGLAIGMLGPLVVYWFHVRYGASATEIGALYFLANLCAAPSNLLSGRLARRFGAVRSVVATRVTAVALLATMALMPSFWLAAVCFLLRTGVNALSSPIRQSYLMGVVSEGDRSTAAGLSNLPLQIASTAGPTVAGQLMQTVWLELPFEIAAALQAVNAALYWKFFRNILPVEEQPGHVEPVGDPPPPA
jgi:MFS family permease